MAWLMNLLAQVAPSDSGLVTSLISGLGSAGLSTGILWQIHQRSETRHEVMHAADRATIQQLTSRLFLLADRGMEVGQTATEVAKGDTTDPRVLLVLERLEAELNARGDT